MPETIWAAGNQQRLLAPQCILDGLFATIGYRLEPGGIGTRFPVIMAQLRLGRLDPAKSNEAAVELDTIAPELRAVPVRRAVWNLDNPMPMDDAGMPVNRSAVSAYDYFVTSSGSPVLDVLRELVEESRRQQKPIQVVARKRRLPLRQVGPFTLGNAVLAAVGYRFFPNRILAAEGFEHGPLLWMVGLLVLACGLAGLLLDRLPRLSAWADRNGGISLAVIVVALAGWGYLAWR